MAAAQIKPRTPEEHIVHATIVWTWVLWVVGAQYHALPLVAWWLAGMALLRRVDRGRGKPLPWSVIVWFASAAILAITLIAGHMDYQLGLVTIVKSMLGWGKGWLLFALLPFAGATLAVRPAIIYRATCILGAQTLVIGALFCVAAAAGAPERLYVSPLSHLGGSDTSFFEVGPYLKDMGSLGFRLRFFAPWAPAAAYVGCLMFVLAAFEKDRSWSVTGMTCGFVMCLLSQSRLGVIAIPVIALVISVLTSADKPAFWGVIAVVAVAGFIGWEFLHNTAEAVGDTFNSARADSTRVRRALQNIALHRWRNEAPLFGHGIVERGSHHVEFMFIGSHHTWFSLLFVKGIVGLIAFAAPLAWTLGEMLLKMRRSEAAWAGVGIVMVLFLFTFAENLEVLAYLSWPALLLLGIAMRKPLRPAY